VIGENATVQQRGWWIFKRTVDVCDECAGVIRTPKGYAMDPDAQIFGMTMLDIETNQVTWIPPVKPWPYG
jgi:hypothetical protein